MSDIDLDRLGDLWRAEPDAEELRALRRAARKARIRGRVAAAFELALAGVMIVALIGVVLINPQPRTGLAASAVILLLLYSQTRQRRFRQIELKSLTGDTATIIDQSVERVEAKLKRTRLGLLMTGPAVVFGFLLAFALDVDGSGEMLRGMWGDGRTRTAASAVAIMVVLIAIAQTVTGFRQSKRELRRLRELQSSYRRERAAGPDRE